MANPRGQIRDKPFRDALRRVVAEIAAGEQEPKALMRIARKMLAKAEDGDVAAMREIADRLDGKVPQAIVGDDEHDAVRLQVIERAIIDPKTIDAKPVNSIANDGIAYDFEPKRLENARKCSN